MVRNYIRKTRRQEWTAAQMDSAVRAVRAGCSKSGAARSFGVPKKTLLRYLSQAEGPVIRRELGSFVTVFNAAQEQQLVAYILEMCAAYYGLTSKDVRSLAYQMAEMNGISHPFNHEEKLAGRDWFDCFRKRFPNLVLRVAEPTSMARARGFNRTSVGKYFDLVSSMFAKHPYPPTKTYNMDEFGVTTVPTKSTKVLAAKGQKQVGGITSAEKGVTTTVVLAMSAAGDYVPPMFIFARQRMNDALKAGAPYGSTFACNPSGWSTVETCTLWFDHFLAHTRPTEDEPVLLILDGHKSHTKNLQLLEKARRNHVRIVSIPPHTSHKLQPCDLTLMASLRSNYDKAVAGLLQQSKPGRVVTPYDICSLMGQSFSQSAIRSTAENGFRRAGLFPLNPGLFTDEDFAAADRLSQVNGNDQSQLAFEPAQVGAIEPDMEENIGVVQLEPEEMLELEANDGSLIIVDADEYYVIEDNGEIRSVEHPIPDVIVDKPEQEDAVQILPESLQCRNEPQQEASSVDPKQQKQKKKRPAGSNENREAVPVSKKKVRWDANIDKNRSNDNFLIPPCDVAAQVRSENSTTKPKRKRNSAKKEVAADLTSDDYYDKLRESSALKDIKNIQKNQRKRRSTPKATKVDDKIEDILCADCGAQFSRSENGNGWKTCVNCNAWYHYNCTNRDGASCGFC